MFFKKGKPLTSLDLCFIANIPTRYQRNLNRAVLRTFKLVPTVVVESHRANVSWTHCLNPYLEHAREVLKDVDPMLFFNLDEVGVQAWADAGSTHVLVPVSPIRNSITPSSVPAPGSRFLLVLTCLAYHCAPLPLCQRRRSNRTFGKMDMALLASPFTRIRLTSIAMPLSSGSRRCLRRCSHRCGHSVNARKPSF